MGREFMMASTFARSVRRTDTVTSRSPMTLQVVSQFHELLPYSTHGGGGAGGCWWVEQKLDTCLLEFLFNLAMILFMGVLLSVLSQHIMKLVP